MNHTQRKIMGCVSQSIESASAIMCCDMTGIAILFIAQSKRRYDQTDMQTDIVPAGKCETTYNEWLTRYQWQYNRDLAAELQQSVPDHCTTEQIFRHAFTRRTHDLTSYKQYVYSVTRDDDFTVVYEPAPLSAAQ